ncbi:MAG: tRNA pseudouridine(55) synthase TruB [Saezia sp.]
MANATPRVRVARRSVHGVILLNKPLGLSSNQALQKVKWLLRASKAGHTGTLDPLATGVLPLCFGAATKFAQIHLDADKCYKATVRLGVVTTTGDSEGEVIRQESVQMSKEQLQNVLPGFLGDILQMPPMYSALKHEGKALYEYARAGIEIERKSRPVTIHELQASLLDAQTFEMKVRCSKGTYIRTLASDIGDALGCGASLIGLERVASGFAVLNDCMTLEELDGMSEEQRMKQLKPPQVLLEGFPVVVLKEDDAGRFLTGTRRLIDKPDTPFVQVMGDNPQALLGIGKIVRGELIAQRLLSPLEIKEYLEQTVNLGR